MSDELEKPELEQPELEQPVNESAAAEEPAVQAAEPEAAAEEPEGAEPTPPQAAAAQFEAAQPKAAQPKAAKAKHRAAVTEPEAAEPAPQAAPAEPEAAVAGVVRNPLFKWYILHAYSGFERKVRESIESRVQAFGLRDRVGRVMIPTEPVTEIVNGKKRTVERVFLPGYVLVEMDLDNNLWHVLKDTPKVTGFLGTGDKPVALSEEEVSSILFRSETAKDKPRLKIKFEKSEQVRITDGPFANFNGVVDEINDDRETMKVMVTIFGRSTPVELEFSKVEKIE
jgi:transcriptional antiterminator NusG